MPDAGHHAWSAIMKAFLVRFYAKTYQLRLLLIEAQNAFDAFERPFSEVRDLEWELHTVYVVLRCPLALSVPVAKNFFWVE